MRKIILSINTTLDGIVSDELSWMQPDTHQSWESLFAMLDHVDLLLLGGGMWLDYRNFWDKVLQEPGFNEDEIKYAQYAHLTKHLIFSSTLCTSGWDHAAIVSGDLKQELLQLKSATGGDIQIVGGGRFATSVINTGLVDEYRMMINPVILGSGQSLYSNILSKHLLQCTQTEVMDNGVVVLTYKAHQQHF